MDHKKNIFLTGASGNMGYEGFKQLLDRRDRFNIVALVLPTEKDRKIMTKYEKEAGVKIVWGDLTDYHDVLKCVEGADYVLHVGGLVSPAADYLPSMTTNDIKIRKDERLLAAKSIMGVMCLAIRKGEEITLIADGIDECKAIKSIETFLTKENL